MNADNDDSAGGNYPSSLGENCIGPLAKHMDPEDLAVIRDSGVPTKLDPKYVIVDPDRGISFTPRGKRLYRLALIMTALPVDWIEKVRNLDELRDVCLKVKQVRVIVAADEAERARNGGRISARSREVVDAARNGTNEDLVRAMERRLLAERAGANVIPVNFRRSKH